MLLITYDILVKKSFTKNQKSLEKSKNGAFESFLRLKAKYLVSWFYPLRPILEAPWRINFNFKSLCEKLNSSFISPTTWKT